MCKKRPFGYEDCLTECWNFEWVKYFETTWGNKCQLIPTRTDMCLDKEKEGLGEQIFLDFWPFEWKYLTVAQK